MGGTLKHSKAFVAREYIGLDDRPHFELEIVDGQHERFTPMWREIKYLAEAHACRETCGQSSPIMTSGSTFRSTRSTLAKASSGGICSPSAGGGPESFLAGATGCWVRDGEAVSSAATDLAG